MDVRLGVTQARRGAAGPVIVAWHLAPFLFVYSIVHCDVLRNNDEAGGGIGRMTRRREAGL